MHVTSWRELKRRTVERETVVLAGQAEGLGEPPWPRAQEFQIVDPSARLHSVDSACWLEGTEQDRSTNTLVRTHDVRAPVDPIGAIHVEPGGRAEHRCIAPGPSAIGVTRRIARRVRLCLHDHAADTVDEECPPDERGRDLVRVALEELAIRRDQNSGSASAGRAVASSRRRARRPRSARSTRPSSAADASRSARSIAPSRSAESLPS